MEIKVSKTTENVYIIEPIGSLDLCSSNILKDKIMKMIEVKAIHFILNLNEVDNINSAGIGALIYIFSTLRKINCPLVLVVKDGPVLQALELTRLKGYFTVVKTLEEAISIAS